jgi:AAA family ATP:ADP antiporter
MSSKFQIKREEWHPVTLSLIYYFCVLASYYVMRPMRDQMAAKVGSANLPLFFAATFLVTLLMTPLFSWAVSKWSRHVVMPLVYLFFVICQLAFIPLFTNQELVPPQFLGFIFFVWVSVFNLFVVSVFWSFMADIWDDAQAKRLFPVLALGGTAGAVFGPVLTRSLVEVIGLAWLLVVSAGLLLIAVVCLLFLGDWAQQFGVRRNEVGNEAALGGGILDGLKQIFTNPFIGKMALLMLLSDAIGTIAYALITDYSGATFYNDAIAQTRFAADMDLWANVIQIVVQLTITRWLLVRYGAGFVFVLCAGIVVAACLMMALIPDPYAPIVGSLPSLALLLILTRSLTHGMVQPARETLYTLVPRDLRYKGKNAVDTSVWRAGDVLSLLSVNGFRSLGVNIAGFGVIWAGLAAISGVIGWRLANRVEGKNVKI